jgi:hypothetical protein
MVKKKTHLELCDNFIGNLLGEEGVHGCCSAVGLPFLRCCEEGRVDRCCCCRLAGQVQVQLAHQAQHLDTTLISQQKSRTVQIMSEMGSYTGPYDIRILVSAQC